MHLQENTLFELWSHKALAIVLTYTPAKIEVARPRVKEKINLQKNTLFDPWVRMHLQENTLFDLDLAKFEVATSKSLEEDTITRKVTARQTTDRLWYEINIPFFLTKKAAYRYKNNCNFMLKILLI